MTKNNGDVFIAQSKEGEIKAKLTELERWKSRQVYKEVESTSLESISLRWITNFAGLNHELKLVSVHVASKRNRTTALIAQLAQEKAYDNVYTLCITKVASHLH